MIPKETIGQVPVFAQQTQKQVLSLDRHAAYIAGLIASKEDHAPRSFGVSFKHRSFYACTSTSYRVSDRCAVQGDPTYQRDISGGWCFSVGGKSVNRKLGRGR